MRLKLKRRLNKVNRIIVKDHKEKSPIALPKHNTNKSIKPAIKQSKEVKVKPKVVKAPKIREKKKAPVKKKNSASSQKLFKVKKQKVSEDEIQIKESERELEANIVTTQIEVEKQEESKQDLPQDFEKPDVPLEESEKQMSPEIEVNIQEDCKENSGTEEDLNFLMPLEIKRLIKEASQTKEMILESVSFPPVKNSSKILKQIKEISINSIKEIQNCFQRMTETDRKLREYEIKTNHCVIKKNVSSNKFKYVKP